LKLVYIIIFFSINFFSLNIFSQTIAVVNIQSLIDKNKSYLELLQNIDSNQKKYLKKFEIEENQLQLKLKNIEDSKLILNENEINIQINEYNNQLSEFTIMIENFNSHYQNQIINIREFLLIEIIKLLENYANNNNIDLILDSTNYLIASNSLDITTQINNELNNLNFKLEYKDFEKD